MKASTPINRRMDKEDVVHIYTMQYYSATKINKTVVMRMDLESVPQSEVSQKEKIKYPVLTHMNIYGSQKNGTDLPICRARIEAQIQRRDMWTQRGRKH